MHVVCGLITIIRIRFQPLLVGFHKGLKVLRLYHFLALFGKELLQIFVLHAVDSLIVAIGQRIQLLATTQKLRHLRLGAQRACRLQVDIMGMQGKVAHQVVGTRVRPLVAQRSIVDWQQLDDFHARSHRPVDETAQVAEVAHAIAMLATQRKNGNADTSQSPRLLTETQRVAIEHQHFAVVHFDVDRPVVALLPLQ